MTGNDGVIEELRAYIRRVAQTGCPATSTGVVWYCDVHHVHGATDDWSEAEVMARSHMAWRTRNGTIGKCELHYGTLDT